MNEIIFSVLIHIARKAKNYYGYASGKIKITMGMHMVKYDSDLLGLGL